MPIIPFLLFVSVALSGAWLGYMFGLQTQELRMLRSKARDTLR